MKKPIWTSKTFWVNIMAVVVMALQTQTGFIIDLEAQAAILAVINVILRAVTGPPVSWKKGNGK